MFLIGILVSICHNQFWIPFFFHFTSIPFLRQTWRYSFIEIFPSFKGSAESKIAVRAKSKLFCICLKKGFWFCPHLRGSVSPSVFAPRRTPFWRILKPIIEQGLPFTLSESFISPKSQLLKNFHQTSVAETWSNCTNWIICYQFATLQCHPIFATSSSILGITCCCHVTQLLRLIENHFSPL